MDALLDAPTSPMWARLKFDYECGCWEFGEYARATQQWLIGQGIPARIEHSGPHEWRVLTGDASYFWPEDASPQAWDDAALDCKRGWNERIER